MRIERAARLAVVTTLLTGCPEPEPTKDPCPDPVIAWVDGDGDGFGSEEIGEVCALSEGEVDRSGDCDDADPDVHPDAEERCNGRDDNCIDGPDEGLEDSRSWFADDDGDGFGAPFPATFQCGSPGAGWADNDLDCDDTNPDVNPAAPEICNDSVDDDCDFLEDDLDPDVDPTTQLTWFVDDDGDGFGSAAVTLRACAPPIGYADNDGDCADRDATRNPDATEVCNGIDDDCDASVDDADPSLDTSTQQDFFRDDDGDGWGDPGGSVRACSGGSGRVSNDLDCDDSSPLLNQDDADADGFTTCDGDCDDTRALVSPDDIDNDGFTACDPIPDCGPTLASVYPGAPEVVADAVDQDCDGADDCYQDLDRDTFGSTVVVAGTTLACDGFREADNPDDCDDTDDRQTVPRAWYDDTDGDGYGAGTQISFACAPPIPDAAPSADDCDDGDASINPGAEEVCDDLVDDDCDGSLSCCGLDDALEVSGWPAEIDFNYCWGSTTPCPYPPGTVSFLLEQNGDFVTSDGSDGSYTTDEATCAIRLDFTVGTVYQGDFDEAQCFDGEMESFAGATGTWAGCLQ